MDNPKSLLKLLEVLNSLGLKFTTKDGDTIFITDLTPETQALLTAVLLAEPDEFGEDEEGYRLWWD